MGDEDEVGIGIYLLVGFAATVAVVMYGSMGYMLYQDHKSKKNK